jgi:hypothetical protein
MNTKIAPTGLTQRPPRSFHVRLGGFVYGQAAGERYDPIFKINVKGFLCDNCNY